jgi:serine/threonine protein kinase
VLTHIAERLNDLHTCGYVHRDIKPGNIMWLPRKKRWTLIDFGCAARAGTVAPIGFTLAYAAPEVIRAHAADESSMYVAESMDAWSVGMLALEMLSGQPVFNMLQPKEQVRSQESVTSLCLVPAFTH